MQMADDFAAAVADDGEADALAGAGEMERDRVAGLVAEAIGIAPELWDRSIVDCALVGVFPDRARLGVAGCCAAEPGRWW